MITTENVTVKIEVELDEKQVSEVSRLTGLQQTSPAIAEALQEFIRQKQKEAFLKDILAGNSDYQMTNEQIEQSLRWSPEPNGGQ